jgi:hypothetical protein
VEKDTLWAVVELVQQPPSLISLGPAASPNASLPLVPTTGISATLHLAHAVLPQELGHVFLRQM